MFNRSLKYIVLVVINIIILYFFFYEETGSEDVLFDADFVINLLDNNKNLQRKIVKLDLESQLFAVSIDEYKRQISQTDSNLKASKSAMAFCENQKALLTELSERQATEQIKNRSEAVIPQMQCTDNLVKLDVVSLQLKELQKRIIQLNDENGVLTSELSQSNTLIDTLNKNADKFASNESGLIEMIEKLRDDLNSSIYVKKFYVTPRYCEGVRNKEVICLEKVLVMADFSKLPFTDVLVKLKDPQGNVIGELTYNPQNTKIVTFPFSNRAEFVKGDFEISFAVDNLLLVEQQSFRHDEERL